MEGPSRVYSLYSELLPLVEGGRTGRLHVRHWDRKEGIVGLNNGQIVHSRYGSLKGMEALNVMRNWITVSFRFNEGVENLQVDIAHGTSSILAKLHEYHSIISEVKKAVPSPYTVFAINSDLPEDRVSMSRAAWKVLSMVNGRNTVKDICVALKASELSVSRVLSLLNNHGFIRLVSVQEPIGWEKSSQFLKELESQLALYIGPIAPVVVDDALGDLGKSRDLLEKGDLPLLIEKTSYMIEETKERIFFQEQMLQQLRSLQEAATDEATR